MNRFRRCCLVVVCLGSLSTFVSAQNPLAAAPHGPRANPTNIKALPKNITGDEIHEVMHKYEADLGVECEYCHARNSETKRNDFPSDANPVKDKARLMIKMTEEINTRHLAQMPDHKADQTVTCGTCHRGTAHPEAFVPKPSVHSDSPTRCHATRNSALDQSRVKDSRFRATRLTPTIPPPITQAISWHSCCFCSRLPLLSS